MPRGVDVEDAVVDAAVATGVDDRALRPVADDGQAIADVEVAGLADVLVGADDGQRVGAAVEQDDVVAGKAVGVDDGAAQGTVVGLGACMR